MMNLSNLSIKKLVSVYNSYADKPVKHFRDRKTAIERCEKVMTNGDATLENTSISDVVAKLESDEAAHPEPAEQVQEKKKRRGRPVTIPFPADAVITRLIANPKRRGGAPAKRFDLYRSGLTVGEYVEKVGSPYLAKCDLKYDLSKNYIKIG